MYRLWITCVVVLLIGCEEKRTATSPSSFSNGAPAAAPRRSEPPVDQVAEQNYLDDECRNFLKKPGYFVYRFDYASKPGREAAFSCRLEKKKESPSANAAWLEEFELDVSPEFGKGRFESAIVFDGDDQKVVFEKHTEEGRKNKNGRTCDGKYYLRVIIPSSVPAARGGVRNYVEVGAKSSLTSQAAREWATSERAVQVAQYFREGCGGTIAEVVDGDTGAIIAFVADPRDAPNYYSGPSGGSGAPPRSGSGGAVRK